MAQKKHLRHWEEKNKACLLNTMEPFSRPKTSKLRSTSYAISGFFLSRHKSGSLVQSGETCFIRETLIKQHSAAFRGRQCNRCGCKLKSESKLWKEKTSGLKVDVRRLICPPSSSAALIEEMAVQPRGTVLQQRAISSLTACALKSNYTNLLILVNKEPLGPNKPDCLSSWLKNNTFWSCPFIYLQSSSLSSCLSPHRQPGGWNRGHSVPDRATASQCDSCEPVPTCQPHQPELKRNHWLRNEKKDAKAFACMTHSIWPNGWKCQKNKKQNKNSLLHRSSMCLMRNNNSCTIKQEHMVWIKLQTITRSLIKRRQ